MSQRILLVDDEALVTREIKEALEEKGFSVMEEQDSGRALETIRTFRPHAVLLDYLMPKAHGGDVAWQIESDPSLKSVRVIILSQIPAAELYLKMPPREVVILEKPVDMARLVALLRCE